MIVGEQTDILFVGNHADKDAGAILADGSLNNKRVMLFTGKAETLFSL